MPARDDVRALVVALATGKPERRTCANWTPNHWDVAFSEGLGPWLYKSLGDGAALGVNSDVVHRLREHYRSSALVCLQREVALRKFVQVFNDRGIPMILLKGSYLGRFAYGDQALRPMVDVDVLVAEDHFEQAGRELQDLGYKTSLGTNQFEEELLKLPKVYGLIGSVPLFIDIHRVIRCMDYYSLPSETVWAEASENDLFGRRVFYLSPELNFIHLALHNLNHRGMLRDWLDLVVAIRTLNLNWERLMGLARSVGAVRPLFWVFRELERNWNTPASPRIAESLHSYAPHWLEDLVIRNKYCYFWRLGARIALIRGWRNRLRYLVTKLVALDSERNLGFVTSGASLARSKVSLIRHLGKRQS